jgi:hypothetical protein
LHRSCRGRFLPGNKCKQENQKGKYAFKKITFSAHISERNTLIGFD